jgi:hypothetical protein
MSFDLGVWYSDAPMTQMEAAAFYRHVNTDWMVVRRHPQFDAFWSELLKHLPDLRGVAGPQADLDEPPNSMLLTVQDIRNLPPPTPEQLQAIREHVPEDPPEISPWAATLAPQGSAVALPIRGNRVRDAAPVIRDLAARHGLVFYDPQSGMVTLPPRLLQPVADAMPVSGPTLHISGATPSLAVRVTLDDQILLETDVASRREAHSHARALALENNRSYYAVDDPDCLTQSIKLEPIAPEDLRPIFREALAPGSQVHRLVLPDAKE